MITTAHEAKNRTVTFIGNGSREDAYTPEHIATSFDNVENGYILLFERMIEQSKEDIVKLRTKTPKGLKAIQNIRDIANAKRFLYDAADMLGVKKIEIDLLIQKLEAEREAKYGKNW